jgi:tetratricopeptide (TPR) repeat protein
MALLELGSVVFNLGDAGGAVRVARWAGAAAAGGGGTGPESHAGVAAATFLGVALSEAGRPGEAAGILRRALEAARGSLGPRHPDTLNCVNILAVALRRTGLLSAGEAVMSEALEGLKGHPEERGRHAAQIRCNLAPLFGLRGDTGRAVGLLRSAYADLRRLRGPDNPHALTAGSYLAYALLESGEADQAVALYREILNGMSGFPPEGQAFVRATMENLARAEAAAGRGGGSH